MYANVLQMMICASGSYGPVATETHGNEKLTCTWVYGHPHEWAINGSPIRAVEAAEWLSKTYAARKKEWADPRLPSVYQNLVELVASYKYTRVIRARRAHTSEPLPMDVIAQEYVRGRWVDVRSFDSMSDDMAYTNARGVAEARDRARQGEEDAS